MLYVASCRRPGWNRDWRRKCTVRCSPRDAGGDRSSRKDARIRSKAGIEVVKGVAEFLLFEDETFNTALIVTTICFVDDIPRTVAEAERILTPSGALVIGYIDKNSPLGQTYQEMKEENPFYREAVFVSTEELVTALEAAGFTDFEFVQTIYHMPDEIDGGEPIEEGYGDGSFVGIKATW